MRESIALTFGDVNTRERYRLSHVLGRILSILISLIGDGRNIGSLVFCCLFDCLLAYFPVTLAIKLLRYSTQRGYEFVYVHV